MKYTTQTGMDLTKNICSSIHAVRRQIGVPTSQPLRTFTLYKDDEMFEYMLSTGYSDIISDECNIKNVNWEIAFPDDYTFYDIQTKYIFNYKEAGKVFGKDTQLVGGLVKEGLVVAKDGYYLVGEFKVPHELIDAKRAVDNTKNLWSLGCHVALVEAKSFYVLDVRIYEDLTQERYAREITKLINTERRLRGFDVGDTVYVSINIPAGYEQALWDHFASISRETKSIITLTLGGVNELSVNTMDPSWKPDGGYERISVN